MLYLVTGATGFIGSHLIRSLYAEGHRVRAIVRPESDIGVLTLNPVEIVEADLISGRGLRDALHGVDVVFHLAAPRHTVDTSTGQSHRRGSQDVIVKGTEALVAAVEDEPSTRIIMTSTAHVYAEHSRLPVKEDAPTHPSTAYGKARLEAERIVRTLNNGRSGRYTIARLTSVYGTGDRQYVSLFRQIANSRFRLIGSGKQVHHVSFVEDVVRGLLACARVEQAAGQTLNIGGPPTSLREFLGAVASAAGVPLRTTPMLEHPARAALRLLERTDVTAASATRLRMVFDYHLRPRYLDVSRSYALLGNYGSTLPEAGIASSVNWYLRKDHNDWRAAH
jgi:nucleoside-diphosphate-sugar epimerase